MQSCEYCILHYLNALSKRQRACLPAAGLFGTIASMSTPPRRTSKTVSKRRADRRRRSREIGKQIFAYSIIALLVLGTISTVFVAQLPVATDPGVVATPTIGQSPLDVLVTQADQAAATGNYTEAIGLYSAYLGQNPGSAEVNFKIAQAHLNSTPPNYTSAASHLNRALSLNPNAPFAQAAQATQTAIAPFVTPAATITGTAIVTGTATITGVTALPATTITPTQQVTTTTVPDQ